MTRSTTIILAVACVAHVGCDNIGHNQDADVRDIATTYKNLRAITRSAVYVNRDLAESCIGASHAQVQAAREEHGPHAHCAVKIYMNDLATNAFTSSAYPFPEGAVVVKEKHVLPYNLPDGSFGTDAIDGVGGMIKRHAGYDAEHGDWEYFYFSDPNEVEHGTMKNCAQCHEGAKTTDFVFGNWQQAK